MMHIEKFKQAEEIVVKIRTEEKLLTRIDSRVNAQELCDGAFIQFADGTQMDLPYHVTQTAMETFQGIQQEFIKDLYDELGGV
jgi:hypothetical protein